MKPDTLNLNKDFRRLYGRGKAFVHPLLVTYVCRNRCSHPRIGITTGKKLGGAVVRNRARRVIMAAWYSCRGSVRSGVDIVFVARQRTAASKSDSVLKVMRSHLSAAGVLEGGEK